MAASAKPRQVLECLNLIGESSHIEKLKSNEGCRMSVITMLTAQISKRNIIPNVDLVRAGMNGLLACQGIDEEIYRLLKEFMQICLFPQSDYQKIFNPDQWKKENPNDSNENPLEVYKDEFRHPIKCRLGLELMYESYKINIRKYRKSVPFMDMIALTGFSHLAVTLEGLNTHYCDLLITFLSILAESNLTRVGQNNTRSSHIIANSTKVSQPKFYRIKIE